MKQVGQEWVSMDGLLLVKIVCVDQYGRVEFTWDEANQPRYQIKDKAAFHELFRRKSN
jgi:hypothetical protein